MSRKNTPTHNNQIPIELGLSHGSPEDLPEVRPKSPGFKFLVTILSALALGSSVEMADIPNGMPKTPLEYTRAAASPYSSCVIIEVSDDHSKVVNFVGNENRIIDITVKTNLTPAAEQTYSRFSNRPLVRGKNSVRWEFPTGAGWIVRRDSNQKYSRSFYVLGSGLQVSPFLATKRSFWLAPEKNIKGDAPHMLVTMRNEAEGLDAKINIWPQAVHRSFSETPCGWLELSGGTWQISAEPLPAELTLPVVKNDDFWQ